MVWDSVLNFGISDLNLEIFASSLGQPSLRPWAACGGEAGSDTDKMLTAEGQWFCSTLRNFQADLWNLEELIWKASIL